EPPEAEVSADASDAALSEVSDNDQGAIEEEPPAGGFFFGRRLDDDDGFPGREAVKKERNREFEW
ncbi:MAG: hypothetical protein ABH877_02960, partial [bacterium]